MLNIQTKHVELVETVQCKNWKQWRAVLHISNSYQVFRIKAILEIIREFPAKVLTTACNCRSVTGMKLSRLTLMKTNNFKHKIVFVLPGSHYI